MLTDEFKKKLRSRNIYIYVCIVCTMYNVQQPYINIYLKNDDITIIRLSMYKNKNVMNEN